MRRTFCIAAMLIAIWAGSARPGEAQTLNCLSPGDLKDDFSFDTQVVNNSLIRKARTILSFTLPADPLPNPSIWGHTTVQFAGPTILLETSVNRPFGIPGDRQIEAFARGKLSADFTVDCGTSENASAVVAVSFQVRRVGRITTFSPGSTSTFAVSARIRDVAENRDIDYRVIDDTSVGSLLGSWKMVGKVPAPVPEIDQLSLAKVETFVIQVRKGRLYRFELFAAARSTTGLHGAPVSIADFAKVNFFDPVAEFALAGAPGIELAGFKMDVGLNPTDVAAEVSELKRMVESLREAVATLGAQLEAVGPNMEVIVSDLQNKLGEQDERHGRSVEQLRGDVETQTGAARQALDALTGDFESHTHAYLTGEGVGHNTTSVTTSTPKKKGP